MSMPYVLRPNTFFTCVLGMEHLAFTMLGTAFPLSFILTEISPRLFYTKDEMETAQ